ncbi:hypothetical protein [Microbacterium sp. PAMC22086]|uniref:hypothetical protein n=1 Tax=Microbacterium sp. PAMC22086 TaxID=2861281 RepID=UPI001C626C78|nr:hypothetical protein [Microbacterium sp. PAMC22086]QYG12544.1 hypothetical protein KY497_04535 [Microbacterium sp. PAMC22086]
MSARTATTSRRALAVAAVLAATASGLAAFPQAATAAESDVTLTPNPAYAGAPLQGVGFESGVDGERDRLVPGRAER